MPSCRLPCCANVKSTFYFSVFEIAQMIFVASMNTQSSTPALKLLRGTTSQYESIDQSVRVNRPVGTGQSTSQYESIKQSVRVNGQAGTSQSTSQYESMVKPARVNRPVSTSQSTSQHGSSDQPVRQSPSQRTAYMVTIRFR